VVVECTVDTAVPVFAGAFCVVVAPPDSGFTGCPELFPSAPLLGSGAPAGIPFADGVPLEVVGACVIAGGLFW
jgi:hypothetical protein